MTLLEKGLFELDFSHAEIERLSPLMEKYASEILLFNSAQNLVSAKSREEIIVRHILDSLSAAKIIEKIVTKISQTAAFKNPHSTLQNENPLFLQEKNSFKNENAAGGGLAETPFQNAAPSISHIPPLIADIGSGAGLPGIPLAAALPKFNFVLVERMQKRCVFLENCVAILGLKNVAVKNAELEKIEGQSFFAATFRAFRPLEKKIFSSLNAILKNGGALFAYKAKQKKIVQEMNALFLREGEDYKIIRLDVPFLNAAGGDECEKNECERNLVLIEKRK